MEYILHYVGNMNRGGMENVIMNLYRAIDKDKFQFHFAVHGETKPDYEEEIVKLGGKIIRFPMFRNNPLYYKKKWMEFWSENKDYYKWFHYHTNSLANITAIKAANLNGMNNIIIHAHSSYANKGKFQKIHDLIHYSNQKFVNNKKFICVAVSQEAANWLFGNTNKQVRILNNGIDYDKYRPDIYCRTNTRTSLGILDTALVIGHVGNFMKVKNHTYLIQVLKEVKNIKKDTYLLLLGDGILRNEIEIEVKKEGLSDNVIFVGNVEEVTKYLNAMDVFVFPSYYEGLGLSVIEAQVNQLPVIVSSSLPKEVKISPELIFLNLDDGEKIWAENVLKAYNPLRMQSNIYLDQKFNIQITIEEIANLYESKRV